MNSENEREYNEQIDRLMHNIKIRNTNGKGSPSQILINDKEFPGHGDQRGNQNFLDENYYR